MARGAAAVAPAAFASAALPYYAWMVWLSHQGPAISFYGPIDGWAEFWFYVSRADYAGVDVSPAAGWGDRWSYLGWFAADLVRQATLPGTVLAVLGLRALARGGPAGGAGSRFVAGSATSGPGLVAAAVAGSGVLALLGNSAVLIVLLGFDFEPFRLAVFRPYPLVCYGVAALWVAAGLQWAMDRLPDWAAARWPAAAAGLSRLGDRLPDSPLFLPPGQLQTPGGARALAVLFAARRSMRTPVKLNA